MALQEAVILGIGELGGVFARGFLRSGCVVHPILRNTSIADVRARVPTPSVVLLAVGEQDLEVAIARLPADYRSRVALLQNELVPGTWLRFGIVDPTVAVVWFEKKPGKEVTVVLPTVLSGPRSGVLNDALGALGIPTRVVSPTALPEALLHKNVFIVTTNIAGLDRSGSRGTQSSLTCGELWDRHRDYAISLAREVFHVEVRTLPPAPVGHAYSLDAALETLEQAVRSDPNHVCAGRSAPMRLSRFLGRAGDLATPLARRAAQRANLEING